jgi:hypothetical protein
LPFSSIALEKVNPDNIEAAANTEAIIIKFDNRILRDMIHLLLEWGRTMPCQVKRGGDKPRHYIMNRFSGSVKIYTGILSRKSISNHIAGGSITETNRKSPL